MRSRRQVLMPAAVLGGILSDPKLPSEVCETLLELLLIKPAPGYWRLAGGRRATAPARPR